MSTSGSPQPLRVAAVVLTGGTGSRLGGVDKGSIELAGVTLLERALAATLLAAEVVVVGEQVLTSRRVTWTREDPAGGGPAAGVLAGLDAFRVEPDLVCVLAVDMPLVTASTVARLRDAVSGTADTDGAMLADDDGEPQMLAGVYRYGALVAARPPSRAGEPGLSVRSLLSPLRTVLVAAMGEEGRDVDTWEDLRSLDE